MGIQCSMKKEQSCTSPTLLGRCQYLDMRWMRVSLPPKKTEVILRFFNYLKSKENTVSPDVAEYNRKRMKKPVYDLIHGCKTMKELGIVLDFQTKQITIDEIILPMTNINSLAKSKLAKAWAVNNSMPNKPTSTVEATDKKVHILDAKYEKADIQAVVSANCTCLSPDQTKEVTGGSHRVWGPIWWDFRWLENWACLL